MNLLPPHLPLAGPTEEVGLQIYGGTLLVIELASYSLQEQVQKRFLSKVLLSPSPPDQTILHSPIEL